MKKAILSNENVFFNSELKHAESFFFYQPFSFCCIVPADLVFIQNCTAKPNE